MNQIPCPICANPLSVRVAKGRRSNKSFIMLKCEFDGRHFRGFITDRDFVAKVISKLPTGKGTGTGASEK